MTKPANRPSVREEKAAALDDFVKAEIARVKTLNEAKAARLKALRLARDEANPPAHPQSAQRTAPFRMKLPLRARPDHTGERR